MAVARTGGGFTALHAWLIAFVSLWLASTVGVVLMYTERQQLIDRAESAERAQRSIAPASELNDPLIRDLQQYATSLTPAVPLVRVMANEIHELSGLITGDQTHSRAVAEARLDQLYRSIAADKAVPNPEKVNRAEGAVAVLKQMYLWYRTERQGRLDAEEFGKSVAGQLAAAQERMKDIEAKFGDTLAAVKKQVEDLQSSKASLESEKQKELADIEKRLTTGQEQIGQLKADLAKQAGVFDNRLKEKKQVIEQQLARIGEEVGEPPERAAEDSLAREPIGRVIRALPGDALVHIDLGELDGVAVGMRFGVYSADRRIPADGRGKANIEVVSMGPHTSECRVTTPSPPDDPILEEDYVQNVILARNRSRKQRFVIVGQFDVDYDGRLDPNGAARIQAYVERFGGEVATTVDAAVDFLVVGRPDEAAPAASDEGETDPGAQPRARIARRNTQSYEAAVERARLLGVPRLRQDVFLNFVGLEPGPSVAKRLLR